MRAQSSSPCVVFFDELDALVPRRDDSLVSLVVYLPLHVALNDSALVSPNRVLV